MAHADLQVPAHAAASDLDQVRSELIRQLPKPKPLPAVRMQMSRELLEMLVIEPTLSKHHRKLPRIAQRLHRSLTQRTGTSQIDHPPPIRPLVHLLRDRHGDRLGKHCFSHRTKHHPRVTRPLGEAAIVEPGPPTNAHGRPQRLLGTRRAKIATLHRADGPGACR
jgi:hypothetical protein